MILDDGGDATLLIHLGVRAETGDTKFLDGASNEEEEVLFAAIKPGISVSAMVSSLRPQSASERSATLKSSNAIAATPLGNCLVRGRPGSGTGPIAIAVPFGKSYKDIFI
jgi:hypothetical protein